MKNKDLIFSYIQDMPFDDRDMIDNLKGILESGNLEGKGKKSIEKYLPLMDWKAVDFYKSGRQKIVPLFSSASLWPNRIILRLNKNAAEALRSSMALAEKQNKPFNGKYIAMLAFWLEQMELPMRTDKAVLRAVLGIPAGYKDNEIPRKILEPTVKELNALWPGLVCTKEDSEYVFENGWVHSRTIPAGGECPPVSQIMAAMRGESMNGISDDEIKKISGKMKARGIEPTERLARELLEDLEEYSSGNKVTTWCGFIGSKLPYKSE